MPAGEMYNSLHTGLIDGIVTDPSAIGDFELDEVANSHSLNAPLGRFSFHVVMNAAKYQELTDEQKAAIDTIAGRPLSKSAADGWAARTTEVTDGLEAAGGNTVYTLTVEERAAFGTLTCPVMEAIVSERGTRRFSPPCRAGRCCRRSRKGRIGSHACPPSLARSA